MVVAGDILTGVVISESFRPGKIEVGQLVVLLAGLIFMVMGNLMLAAHSLGLGSCWIHRAKEEFQLPECKELLKTLGVEGEYEGIGHLIVGYPDGDTPELRPRKENYVYYID